MPKKPARKGIESMQFPQNSKDDLCLLFSLYPSSMGGRCRGSFLEGIRCKGAKNIIPVMECVRQLGSEVEGQGIDVEFRVSQNAKMHLFRTHPILDPGRTIVATATSRTSTRWSRWTVGSVCGASASCRTWRSAGQSEGRVLPAIPGEVQVRV